MQGDSIVVSALPAHEFLPVMDLRFDGDLIVQPAAVESDGSTHYSLPENADRAFNTNGEGYYDPPTLRNEKWHVSLKRAGPYKVVLAYKRGRFSRVVDVKIGSQLLKANLYGDEEDSASAGPIELSPNRDLTVSLTPGSPAMRGAKLDLEITRVSLIYSGPK